MYFMNIKNWYNELLKVKSIMDSLTNTPAVIDGATRLLNSDSLKTYSNAISGLSEKQALLALSSKYLTDEQKKQILTEAGIIGNSKKISAAKASEILASTALSKKKKEELLADIGLVDAEGVSVSMSKEAIMAKLEESVVYKGLIPSKQKEVRTAIAQTFATETETVSREGLVAVMGQQLKMQLALIATNPITWILAGVAALVIFTKAYAKLTTSANEANEAVSNAIQTSQNNLKSVREQKDNVDKLTESYEKLSKGVNTATNENLTLSTDDYKEYLDTCNQIADMYPELVSGYDAQGNAILSLKGNVQGLTDAYKEAQQEAYKTAFVGVTDEDGKTTGGISDVEKQFSYATNGYDPGDHWWNRAKLTTNRRIEQLKELQDMSLEEIKRSGYTYSEALKDSGININDLLTATENQLPEYKVKINDFIQKLIQTQEDAVSNAKSSIEGYMKGVTDASGNALASGYDKLTEKQQNLATSFLSSLDESKLQEFMDSGDFEGAAKKWVNNIVSSISTMSAEAKNAYDELQKSIANPGDLTTEGISNIDKYLYTLSDELGVTKDKLKDIFNLDDIFDTQTSFDNLVKQYLGEDTFNELSNGAKKAANSIDKLAESEMNHKASMITLNERYKKNLEEKSKQEQYTTKVQAEEEQKRQKELEESAKRHANAIVVANERIKKNRQEAVQKTAEGQKNQKLQNDNIQNTKKQIDEIADSTKTSHKEVASNIQQVWDEADKSISKSTQNIIDRNQGAIDAAEAAGAMYSDYQKKQQDEENKTLQDQINSAEAVKAKKREIWDSYIDAQEKAQLSNAKATQKQAENVNKIKSKIKEIGYAYIDAQNEANQATVQASQAQAEMTGEVIDKVKSKFKELGSAYIDSQQQSHANDVNIAKHQTENAQKLIDNVEKAKNKFKELGVAALESQNEANKYNAQATQQVAGNISNTAEKAKNKLLKVAQVAGSGYANTSKSEHANADLARKAGSAVAGAAQSVWNSKPVKYIKDTVKDINDINAAVTKAKIETQKYQQVNESVSKVAASGINNIISSTEKMSDARKREKEEQQKSEEASKRRAEAETTINNRLKKQNEERAKQEEAQQQRANDMATVNARVKTNLAEQSQKQAEEQQKQAEKNARWEKDYQIEAELAAKKREKNVTSEEEAQKKLSSEYRNMTLSQKKMFLEANNGSNGLVETYEKYNKLLENNALNSLPFEIDDITTHITNLNTALSESASATGLTSESIKNLTSMFSGLEGYNASTLFENTANGVKLNRKELEKLNQAYVDDKTKDAKDNLSLLTDKYNELTQEINNCSDTSKLANLYSQRDAVMDQINDVQQLISQYDGLTSAFNEWQNAQNETSPGANYDSMYSYIDTANKLAKDGKWGNPALKKYIELISGKDLSNATAIEMKQAWESLGGTIGNTGHNLMEFLSEDKTGVEKFVDTLKKLDKGYVQVGEDGQNIINIDNMDDLAQKMGTDVSYVQVLLDKLSEYGWDIHVNSSDLELLTTNAEKAEETLHDLGFEHVFNFSATTSDDLTKEIDEAYKIFNDDRFKNENGEFDINIKGASEAQQVLVTLLSQKEALSEPLIMDINLDKLSGTNKQVIDNLQVIQSTIDGYQIQLGANMDTSEMEKKVGDSLDLIDKIPKDIQDKLGLSDQKVKNAAILLKKNIADGVTLDDTAVKTIEQALDSINPEILAALGINMDEVQKDANETAQAFEDALTSVLSRLTITVGENGDISFHIEPVEVPIDADTTDAEDKINSLELTGDQRSSNPFIMKYNGDASGAESVANSVEAKANAVTQNPYLTTFNGNNEGVVATVKETKDEIKTVTTPDWTAYVNTVANDNPVVLLINKLSSWFTKIKNGLFSATVSTSTSGSTPSTGSKTPTSKNKKGVAKSGYDEVHYANGTFHGFAGGTFLRGYSNGTSVALPRDEYALINEVGEEGILRNGVLHTVPGGAHIEHLRKNDIIFNTKQMEELRKTGYVQSGGGHGKMVGGYASGTLNGIHGYVVGTENNGSTVEYNVSGSGNIVGSTVQYKGADTTKDSSKSKSSNKSSSKSSPGSNSPSSSTDSSSDAEKTKETLDWIETKISRVERVIKNLGKTVDATYKSWSERNQALYQEYSAVNGEIVDQQNAYERYLQEANNVGLDAGYAQLVRDGKIDIETITDDDLKQKIEDYKNWYEKALDCSDAILDLKDNLYDLLQTNFDSITKQFEDQLDVISHSVNMVEGYIDLAETRGYLASTDYYDSLINLERQNIGTLQNEYNSLATTLNNMVNAGQIEKYSEAWYDLYGQICDVEESWQDATKALSEYESKMRELKWSYFEKEQDYITNFTDEMSWLNDLLEKQGKLIDDNGNMTNRGTASMGLHAVGYNTYMSQADDYAKEIQKINEELAKDPFNTILIDKRQEYLKAQRDSIDAAYDEIDAAKSLMKDKYDAELDAIDKLIEKRKDAMSTERDLYNYQKSISEKVNSLSSLEKQRKAYEKDNSEEGMAKRQQLDKSIKDAKTDLQETEWDQQISDVEQMMDNMRDDYEQMLNDRLDNLEFIMNEMLSSANENSESIKTTLTEATASVGTTLSDTMANIWNSNSGLNGIVTGYSNTFSTALTTTNAALASIETMIKFMVQEAQRKAAEDAAMQQQMAQATQAQQPTVPQATQNQTTTAPQQVQNTGLDTGFFIYKQNSYPVSKLNVNSSIIDRLRWKNFDESFSARSSYYAAMNNGDEYTGSASQNVKMLNWMKQNGFSTGGEITDLIGHTKDDGWALVGKKETIIDQQATQNLKDAIQMLNPLQNFINSMTTATVPNVPSTMSQNFENHIDVQMNFPNAKNYEEIKNALLVDNNFEKTMTQAILGGAMGQNSLKKRSMIK